MKSQNFEKKNSQCLQLSEQLFASAVGGNQLNNEFSADCGFTLVLANNYFKELHEMLYILHLNCIAISSCNVNAHFASKPYSFKPRVITTRFSVGRFLAKNSRKYMSP